MSHVRWDLPGHVRCQVCAADMPVSAVKPYLDEGVTYYLCADLESCEARRAGREATPGTTSFLMGAINRLTSRVEELEKWQRTFGGKLGSDGPPRSFLPGRPRRPGLAWDRAGEDDDDPPAAS